MLKNKKTLVNYWMSYSDLMIGLLIVFIVFAFSESKKYDNVKEKQGESHGIIDSLQNKLSVTESQLQKIKILETTFQELADNSDLFLYNEECRRFELNCDIEFKPESYHIPLKDRKSLVDAGKTLDQFLRKKHNLLEVEFAIIIEGRAAKHLYKRKIKGKKIKKEDTTKNKKYANKTKVLSYQRARELQKLWTKNRLLTELKYCDILVVGNGFEGECRYFLEEEFRNKNFIIQIIPKFRFKDENN